MFISTEPPGLNSRNDKKPTMSIGWCNDCNVPVSDSRDCGICGSKSEEIKFLFAKSEIKPVFEEEKKFFLELLLEKEKVIPKGTFFYNITGEVIIDGAKIFRLVFSKKRKSHEIRFFKKYASKDFEFIGSNIKKVVKANEYILEEKEEKSLNFIKKTYKTYNELPRAVSFSGGKDSTVVAYMAKKLEPDIDFIFLNTSIEFDETVSFVHETSSQWNTNLTETKPSQNFLELCELLGPPSRFMKWCCKVCKFEPQNRLINERYQDKVLVISGLRKAESNIRQNFDKIQINKKIPNQILIFPIFEWSSFDVWIYTLWKDLPINELYKKGFFRIGCWACPEKSLSQFKRVEKTHPHLVNKLKILLLKYAEDKEFDVEKFVDDGGWMVRKSKYVKTPAVKRKKPCITGDDLLYQIEKNDKKTKIIEFSRVFGKIEGNGPMRRIKSSQIEISFIGNQIRVSTENIKLLKLFNRQLEKALNCVGCGACVGLCEKKALVIENREIKVTEDCDSCLRCIIAPRLRMGCISLNYKSQKLAIEA